MCELVSPSTARHDRIRKMPIYAESGVQYLWVIDPFAQTFEAFMLESGKWVLVATHAENEKIRAKPFHGIELVLSLLWA